jgi:putative MATE family efflux protein
MRHKLTSGPITSTLFKLTLPMIGGIMAMSAFNLTDTFFVSQLGTRELAAMSFTFPVVMIVGAVAMGLGMGASSVISREIGKGEITRVKRLITDSLLLSVMVVAIFSVIGLLTMRPLFRLLGATENIMPLISSYMTIWYSSVAVLIIPMIGNNCLRATGDTFTPGLLMILLAVTNVILDPIFIFGYCGLPAMGLKGAALATVISRSFGVFVSLYFLGVRYGLLDWRIPGLREMLSSWKKIMGTAAPVAATHMLMPVTSGFVTFLIAVYGEAAVAASGAGGRVLHVTFIVPIALGSVLVPFIGQNWGAGKPERAWKALKISYIFSIYYSLAFWLVGIFFGNFICGFFSQEAEIIRIMNVFLFIMLISSGLHHIAVHSGFALNALGKPNYAMCLNLFQNLILIFPLTALGSYIYGAYGIFIGLAFAEALTGVIAFFWLKKIFNQKINAIQPVMPEPLQEEFPLETAP